MEQHTIPEKWSKQGPDNESWCWAVAVFPSWNHIALRQFSCYHPQGQTSQGLCKSRWAEPPWPCLQTQIKLSRYILPSKRNQAVACNWVAHWVCFSFPCSGGVGGTGADWPPVGTGERWRGPHVQRAGLWRHVHQGAAKRHLLMARSLDFQPGALNFNRDHCRDWVLGEIPSCYAKFTFTSLTSLSSHTFIFLSLSIKYRKWLQISCFFFLWCLFRIRKHCFLVSKCSLGVFFFLLILWLFC